MGYWLDEFAVAQGELRDMQQHTGKPLSEDPNYENEQSVEDFSGCNVIFLDVDGVLNNQSTEDKIKGYAGIDDAKVQILRQMVDILDAKIVLVSSWKGQWYPYAKDRQDAFATILDHRLQQAGLVIVDKTADRRGAEMRGLGIIDWIRRQQDGVGKILILDDEPFDYRFCGLRRYLIQTAFYDDNGGLTTAHIEQLRDMIADLDYVDDPRIDF